MKQKKAALLKRGIECLSSEFIGMYANYKFKCESDGNIWDTTLKSVDQGSICPECRYKNQTEKQKISGSKLEAILEDLTQRKIKLLTPYKGMRSLHTFLCEIDQCEWTVTMSGLAYGKSGCPECCGRNINKNELANRIKTLNDRGIYLTTPYTRMSKIHGFKCAEAGHDWTARMYHVFNSNSGCPHCCGRIPDLEKQLKRLRDRGIELLEPYKGSKEKHWFSCDVDTHKWEAVYAQVNNGAGCPRCSGRYRTEEELKRAESHTIIRNRFREMFYNGATATKVYKNIDGTDTEDYKTLCLFWEVEHTFIPDKPFVEGKWTLDHIIPVSWWNPDNLAEMKLCWDRRNIRWLTLSENSSKRDRIRIKDIPVLTDWHYGAIAQCSHPGSMPTAVSIQASYKNNKISLEQTLDVA